MHSHRLGFTLIELLALLMIIGVMLATGIPKFMRARERGIALREMQQTLVAYGHQQYAYFERHGQYAERPRMLPDFAVPERIFVIQSTGNDTTWSLELGHESIDLTCVGNPRMPPFEENRGKVLIDIHWD